jgi:hypothetical protein
MRASRIIEEGEKILDCYLDPSVQVNKCLLGLRQELRASRIIEERERVDPRLLSGSYSTGC